MNDNTWAFEGETVCEGIENENAPMPTEESTRSAVISLQQASEYFAEFDSTTAAPRRKSKAGTGGELTGIAARRQKKKNKT